MKCFLLSLSFLLVFASCKTLSSTKGRTDNGIIDITFLQINDVYEIAPLSGGREGGVARVATLKKEWRQKNPNSYLVAAGDFLSPSVYNSLPYQGKPIRGRQMVDALNAAGLDFAVFGNHEFDIKEAELQERLNESTFPWISSNSFQKTEGGYKPFVKAGSGPLPKTYILTVKDADGTTAKIGLMGINIMNNRAPYVVYTDPLQTAKETYNRLKDSVDVVVAITHQTIAADELLATELPGLAAIIGGHEHDGQYKKIGNVTITKAVSNAKTAYVVNLQLNKNRGTHKVWTKLEKVNERIALDSATDVVVKKWTGIANDNYAAAGFDATKVLLQTGEPLDGREGATRNRSTNLTRLIVAAVQSAAPQADIVVFNSGSIRVDDILNPPITQYDLLRSLPFGGGLQEADMKGSLIIRMLDAGLKNIGSGGYLQYNPQVEHKADRWLLKGEPIDASKVYRVVLTDFLFTGQEANMDFVKKDNVDVVKLYPAPAKGEPLSDVRLTVVRYLEKQQASK